MANYVDNDDYDIKDVDSRLIKDSVEFFKTSAEDAARTLNTYGKTMGPAERKAYEDLYASSVKTASKHAQQLGVAYKPPEIRSAALTDGKVAGAGTSMMMTKANDVLTTVDGYGKSLEQNLTTIKNSVQSNLKAAKDWMFNTEIPGVGSLSDIKKKTESLNSTLTEMAGQVTSAIDKPVGQLKGMTDGILTGAFSALDELNAELASESLTSMGGNSYMSVLGAKVPAVNQLIDSYNGIKSAKESLFERVRDIPAELSMRLSILDQAGRFGLTDLINRIIKSDDNGNSYYYHVALIDQFDTALGSGNLDIINDMVSSLGVVTVLTRYPDAVQRILRGYRHPTTITAAQWPGQRVKLLATLNSIDPRWEYNHRAPGDLINLNAFNGASDATVELFRTDRNYYRRILAAKNFANAMGSSMVSQVKSIYPYSAITA